MELSVFSASTSKTASAFLLQMRHASNVLRLHILHLVHHNKFLTAYVTSFFTVIMAAFSAILGSTSPQMIARKLSSNQEELIY